MTHYVPQIAATALILLLTGCPSPTSDSSTDQTTSEASTNETATKQAAEAPARAYIDVRTPEEYASGHLSGALNIPLQDMNNRLDELRALGTSITTYCRSGNRSGKAKSLLENAGFTDVTNGGGVEALAKQLGVEIVAGDK